MRVKSRSSISLSWADFLSVSRVPPANSISAVCVAASNLAARVVAERVCFTPTPATVGTGSQNRFDWHAEAIHIIDKPRQGRSYRRQKPLLARTKSLRNNLEIRRSVVTYAGNVFKWDVADALQRENTGDGGTHRWRWSNAAASRL